MLAGAGTVGVHLDVFLIESIDVVVVEPEDRVERRLKGPHHTAQPSVNSIRKTHHSFLNFSDDCPEPVLVK